MPPDRVVGHIELVAYNWGTVCQTDRSDMIKQELYRAFEPVNTMFNIAPYQLGVRTANIDSISCLDAFFG